MPEITTPKNWSDFINEEKYQQTGEAFLYRNPYKETNPENGVASASSNYEFSTYPGDNYIFDQLPIAIGFSALIGHDEVKPGENSLKSNMVFNRVFQTEDYYRNYTLKLFELGLRKNRMLPRPKATKDFELSFYSDQLTKEEEFLKSSEGFYTECLNDDDILLKENLRLYAKEYLQWLLDKMDELNNQENQLQGLGGLTISEASYVYTRFRGKYIHSMTKEKYFVSIFQKNMLPNDFLRVEWLSSKSALFSFMMQTVNETIQAKEIKKYFSIQGNEIRHNDRPSTVNLSIKRILNEAKINSTHR